MRDIETYKNNIKSLTSEIDSFKLNNGELVYEKNCLILEKSELEQYLNTSKKEVKELEKKLDSKIKFIADMESHISVDTLVLHDSVYIDSSGNMSIFFDYSDKWLNLRGHSTQTTFDDFYTTLDTMSLSTPLQVGLTDDYQIFVKSRCPYLHITDVQGATIEESKIREMKRRFGLGIYVGWGVQYGMFTRSFDTGPQLGVGFYYRLY